jgi:hypothetical protein
LNHFPLISLWSRKGKFSQFAPYLWNVKPWPQASATLLMRSGFFCDITRRRVVIVYRRFGTTNRPHLQGSRLREGSWPLKIGTTRCPETMVNNYHTTPRNIAPERRSYNI